MNAVPVSAIFAAAAALSGEVVDPNGTGSTVFVPDADTLARLTTRLNEHLPPVWNAAAWPEVTDVAQWRLFNAAWLTAGLTPTRGQVVIDPDSNVPYLCLATPVASPGSGLVVPELTDTTRWLQLLPEYADFEEWTATGIFDSGTVVRYQVASSGAWYDGKYVAAINPPQGSTPPTPAPGPAVSSNRWIRVDTLRLVYALPDGVGDILNVHPSDPRVTFSDPLRFELEGDGIRVANWPGSAWFTFRSLCPYLFGQPWESTVSYAVGAQVYFVDGGVGDFYEVITATTAPDSPATNPSLFSKIEIPRRFAQYLAGQLSADWLRWDGQVEKSSDQEKAAVRELDRLHFNFNRQQKQNRPMNVRNRY